MQILSNAKGFWLALPQGFAKKRRIVYDSLGTLLPTVVACYFWQSVCLSIVCQLCYLCLILYSIPSKSPSARPDLIRILFAPFLRINIILWVDFHSWTIFSPRHLRKLKISIHLSSCGGEKLSPGHWTQDGPNFRHRSLNIPIYNSKTLRDFKYSLTPFPLSFCRQWLPPEGVISIPFECGAKVVISIADPPTSESEQTGLTHRTETGFTQFRG